MADYKRPSNSWTICALILYPVLCLDIATCAVNLVDGDPEVTLSHPPLSLRGSVLSSRDGRDYYAFRGVRYANPQIGRAHV